MRFCDYHTHSIKCNHAVGTLEEYVQSGIQLNLRGIGLSDHFPMHLLPEEFQVYAMKYSDLESYIRESEILDNKYGTKIAIRTALEVDYYPELFEAYRNEVNSIKDSLDYILGSVHFIPWENSYSSILSIDQAHLLPQLNQSIIDDICLEYYMNIHRMVRTNYFTVLAHFDLPKKYGLKTTSEIIEKIILRILDDVERSNMVVEVNTSGFRSPVEEQFPSDYILRELIDRSIPITLGSDAHQPKDVGFNFSKIYKKLRRFGAKEITRMAHFDLHFDKIS